MKISNKKVVVDTDTGELHTLQPINPTGQVQHINPKQTFIKFFPPLINLLPTLTTAELKIIQYIAQTIKPNQMLILLTPQNTNLTKITYQRAITSLAKKHIIKKQTSQLYTINPDHLFNGKYYKTTIKLA